MCGCGCVDVITFHTFYASHNQVFSDPLSDKNTPQGGPRVGDQR